MPIWNNSSMEAFYVNGNTDDAPCVVRIDGDQIRIEARYADGSTVTWTGVDEGGHYRIARPDGRGKGTLHRFDQDEVLEGHWIEDGQRGMWAITLDE